MEMVKKRKAPVQHAPEMRPVTATERVAEPPVPHSSGCKKKTSPARCRTRPEGMSEYFYRAITICLLMVALPMVRR